MNDTSIRDQIKTAMLDQGISLRQLSRETGIPVSVLSEWMRGINRRRMGDRQLEAIAYSLGSEWKLESPYCPDDDRGGIMTNSHP